ncbi:MAG TPA: response regulator [Myxococcota bacterium]|nr:response regulator [Myxococcota bacterium]HPB49610.1 response regulator [Myxococcota bacterium]
MDRVANLRHDVMNSLTVILGYSKILMGRRDIPADCLKHIDRIQQEAFRCQKAFDDDKVEFETTAVHPDPSSRPAVGVAPASVKVMVVDDDNGIRNLATEVIRTDLVDAGIHEAVTVLAADSISSALAYAAAGRLDAVVIDMNVDRPGGGLALADRLADIDPGIFDRLVFISGGISDPKTAKAVEQRRLRVLFKPFSNDQLCRAVGTAIRGQTGSV